MSNLFQKIPVFGGLFSISTQTHTYLWVQQVTPLQTLKPARQLPNQSCLHLMVGGLWEWYPDYFHAHIIRFFALSRYFLYLYLPIVSWIYGWN